MVGESGSAKLLSTLSSKSSGLNPINTVHPGGGGINDVAFSPDGTRLAVACRDGSCRVLDWPSGHCIAGFQVRGGRKDQLHGREHDGRAASTFHANHIRKLTF
jgi:WD40 repeat protein